MSDKKIDCYKCKFRRNIPGDCHSSCSHPNVGENAVEKLGIQGSPHGIRNGWFMWPFNFDPVWLQNCNGFSE